MKLTARIKRFFTKCVKMYQNLRNPWWMAKKKYIQHFDTLPINEKSILIESQHGTEMNGMVFYLLKYLSGSEKYRDYTIYLCARVGKIKAFRKTLNFYKINNVKLVALSSDEYFQILASAKYLINDNTFLPFFIKKEGQVYLNTWHGTPLKSLGRGIKNDCHAIGNTQKNFVSADYLLFPNEHTKNAILKDYMIENISDGSCIMAGYPRNEAFFNSERRQQLKETLHLENKKIYAYMPTFRGTPKNGGTSKCSHYMNYFLYELDRQLQDDEILYVNLHPVATKDVQFREFKHIRNFPVAYETYDFLNIADVLVTDYSSVFFDFACSRKKIVLFTFDKEDYLADRGMYMSMEELPFPQVRNADELLAELRSGKNYDDTEFMDRFCKYDNEAASQKLCDYVILGQDTGLEIQKIPNNGKKNVIMYAGNLSGNGITASVRNLLSSVDLDKHNFYLAFYTEKVKPFKNTIHTFPEKTNYFAMAGDQNLTVPELFFKKAFQMKWISAPMYMKHQEKRLKQDFLRLFGGAKFDHVIQFNGYEADVILTFSTFDGPNSIFVHSDMLQEIKTRGNQRLDVLKYAYSHYKNVAIVTEDMHDPTYKISGCEENIRLSKNLINYSTILSKAEEPVSFDPVTKTSMPKEYILELLDSDKELFINVGRFSPEKGHERLVSAFAKYHKDHPDSYLIIMGGSSLKNGYANLCQYVKDAGLQEYVILIERVSNPYPIVKACDHFVLSSFYEGFGLVLIEADILGLTVVSTDIPGPRGFMKKYGGTMVDNSEEGILEGMKMLHSGEIEPMKVDYEAYNQEAIREFEHLLGTPSEAIN